MAFFKKKKRKVGPSKNEEKVRRAAAADAAEREAGTLSSRYPDLRALKLSLTVTSPQGAVLEQTDETYGPDDPFSLDAECPGSCGSASHEFTPLVAEALSAGRKDGEIKLVCASPSYGGGPGGTCGCTALLRFTAQ